MNYRLTLIFEGTNYHGWQVQPNAVTVQEVVERAAARTVGAKVHVMGCGRTDAGVHAIEYTANFKADSDLPPERMQGALNWRLPDDVAVTSCCIAPDDFHATLSATGKIYRYTLVAGGTRPVLERNFVFHLRHELDLGMMRAAASHLLGTHDFAAFVTQHDPSKNTVRTIRRLDLAQSGRTFTFEVEGDGFLYNMVRTLVGCLIAIGRGLRQPGWMAEVLTSRDRKQAFETAPAKGLALVKALYP